MARVSLGTFETTTEMRELVNRVLDSGRLTYGPLSREFESRFAQMHGCRYGVLSNSGTSSLLVALQTLKELHGWQDGDEVIIPAITFVATVNVVLHLKLRPVLVDIHDEYYDIDCDLIGDAITDKTRCIIPVNAFGQPAELEQIKNMSGWQHLRIIEDSCEAMYVTRFGFPVGSFGDIACFSTYIAHLLVTGVGGLAITDNPEYELHMRSLVNHGIDLNELPTGSDYDHTWLARKFTFNRIGHSFRLTEMEAALGLAQLDNLASIVAARQQNAVYLTSKLKPLEDRLQLPAVRPHSDHAFMMYVLACRQEGVRDDLCHFLSENRIETRLALPLTRQPCYRDLWEPEYYPWADWMNRNAFYIGCHQGLTIDDLDYVVEKIKDFFRSK